MAAATDASPLAELAIRVHEPGESADVRDIAEWIGTHEGVAGVEHHATTGHIVVRYDERRGAGRYLEGIVRDRLRALRPAPAPSARPLEITIAHELPGRVRLKVTSASGNALARLSAFVEGLEGVERARASPATGSLLVLF